MKTRIFVAAEGHDQIQYDQHGCTHLLPDIHIVNPRVESILIKDIYDAVYFCKKPHGCFVKGFAIGEVARISIRDHLSI